MIDGGGCELTIKEFLEAFKKLREVLSGKPGSFPAGFSLLLELKEDPKPAPVTAPSA